MARKEKNIGLQVVALAHKGVQNVVGVKERKLAAERKRKGLMAQKNAELRSNLTIADDRLARQQGILQENVDLRRRLRRLEQMVTTANAPPLSESMGPLGQGPL